MKLVHYVRTNYSTRKLCSVHYNACCQHYQHLQWWPMHTCTIPSLQTDSLWTEVVCIQSFIQCYIRSGSILILETLYTEKYNQYIFNIN